MSYPLNVLNNSLEGRGTEKMLMKAGIFNIHAKDKACGVSPTGSK